MKNLIFLDIDGILNSKDWCGQYPFSMGYEGWASQINPAFLKILNAVVEATEAFVVLSSTWRFTWGAEELSGLLLEKGASFVLHDVTPVDVKGRADAIYAWLYQHQEEGWSWLALDDSTELTELGDRWVEIPDGLRDYDVDRILRRFEVVRNLPPVFR